MAVNPNAGGLGQIKAVGMDEVRALTGFKPDSVLVQRTGEDAMLGAESVGPGSEDYINALWASGKTVGAGDSGKGAIAVGDKYLLRGDAGKYGGGYDPNQFYLMDAATLDNLYRQDPDKSRYIRGYNPLTGLIEGDTTNGDFMFDIASSALPSVVRKPVGQGMRAIGGGLARISGGALGEIGENFADKGAGLQRGETSAEIAARAARAGRGEGVDQCAGMVGGALTKGSGLGAMIGALIAGGAGSNAEAGRRALNPYSNQERDPYMDAAGNYAVSQAAGTVGQGAGEYASASGASANTASAARTLGAGATTAALTGGDITEAAKQALITYITGLSPAAKQAWTVYRTAQGWDKMNEMQKLQAMQSFYKQMATYA